MWVSWASSSGLRPLGFVLGFVLLLACVGGRLRIGDRIHHVADKSFERLILDELPVELREIFHGALCRLAERLVVGKARGMRGVGFRVLEGGVGGYLWRDIVANVPENAV